MAREGLIKLLPVEQASTPFGTFVQYSFSHSEPVKELWADRL
jgi:hypothetical protein